MKITQTDTQIALKTSGIGQLLFGLILIIGGIALAVFLPGSTDDAGKKAPAWTIIIGIAMVLGGIAAVLFSKNRSVTIVKGGDTTIASKKILGGGPQAQTVPTASIVAVRLSTYIEHTTSTDDNGGNPNNSRRSTLYLVLNNNDLVEAGNSSKGLGFSLNGINVGSLMRKAPLSKEADQLAAFLGVPLQADDTSSIAGAVKALQTVIGQGQEQPPAPQAPAPPPTASPQPPATPQPAPNDTPDRPSSPPPPFTPTPQQ